MKPLADYHIAAFAETDTYYVVVFHNESSHYFVGRVHIDDAPTPADLPKAEAEVILTEPYNAYGARWAYIVCLRRMADYVASANL